MLWICISSEAHTSEHWILKWVRFFFCSLKCFFFTIKTCHRGKMKIQQTDFCYPVCVTVKSSRWKLKTGVCLCLNDLQVLSMNNTSSDNSETEMLPRWNDRYWDVSCLSSHLILKIKSFLSRSTVRKKKFFYYLLCSYFCNQYQRCSMSVIWRDPENYSV